MMRWWAHSVYPRDNTLTLGIKIPHTYLVIPNYFLSPTRQFTDSSTLLLHHLSKCRKKTDITYYNPSNVFAGSRLFWSIMWLNIPQLKLGIPQFSKPRVLPKKDFTDNKYNSLHLARKYVQIFVLGHYLLLRANSFPRTTLSENCLLLGKDNVRGQIS